MSVELRQDVPLPEYIETDEQARELLRFAIRKVETDVGDLIGWDTETHAKHIPIKKKPPDPITDTITFWSLCFADTSSGKREYRRWCLQQQHFLMFSPLLEHPQACFTAWNAKYDAHIAWNCNVNVWNSTILDGLAMAHLHDENRREYSLKACARDWCGLHMTPYKALFDMDIHGNKAVEFKTSLYELDLGLVVDYASYDAFACLYTAEWLRDKLMATVIHPNGRTLWDHFCEFEIPFTRTLWRMERRGLPVDLPYLKELIPKVEEEINELEREINRVSGRPININSPRQLGALFFSPEVPTDAKKLPGLGLNPVKMTKGGSSLPQPSTDEEVMTLLSESAGPGGVLAKHILRCRKLYKMKSTYMEALVSMAEYFPDGRVHPSFHQFGARTGRLSTANPNSQNLPRPDGDEFGIRKAFIAPPGKKLIVADYCLAGGTMVDTPQGPTPIESLKEGDLVYSYNQAASVPCCSRVRRRVYKGRRKTIKVTLDNGRSVRTTGDHRWIRVSGEEVNAEDLAAGDRLLSLRRSQAGTGYLTLYSHSSFQYTYEHRAVALAHLGPTPEGCHVHHLDGDPYNNRPESIGSGFWVRQLSTTRNLVHVKMGEHLSKHSSKTATKMWADPETRDRMSRGISRSIEERGGYHGDNNPNYGNRKGDPTTCGYCGKEFYQPPCRKAKFCGRECYFNSKNHTVSRVDHDNVVLPVYDIEVEDHHNFALCAGVFVHNCQLEMRIMADRSQDAKMIQAIQEGKDLHSFTAGEMEEGVSYEEVADAKKAEEPNDRQKWLKGLRQGMKAVGFGIIYGAGPSKIAQNITISEADADRAIGAMDQYDVDKKVHRKMKDNPLLTEGQAVLLVGYAEVAREKIESYFRVFPRVKAFMDGTPVNCKYRMTYDLLGSPQYRPDNAGSDAPYNWDVVQDREGAQHLTRTGHPKPFGFVQTYLGRYRRLEDIDHRQYQYRGHAERESVNTIIQGTAADLAKGAMLRVEGNREVNMMGAQLLNQIHDELVIEVPEEYAEEALPIIVECMEHPFVEGEDPLCVPTPVDARVVDNWAQAK